MQLSRCNGEREANYVKDLVCILWVNYVGGETEGLWIMAKAVPAAEFTRNFGRYKLQAQREAVPVSSNGTLEGYFVSPHEYEELRRLKDMCRSFDIAELRDEEFAEIEAATLERLLT